jgi:sorting nexin-7/30/sorting nexin-8
MNNDGADGNYSAYNQDNQDNGIYNEQYESNADIYGITNLETITCSVIEKSEMSKYENVQIEMSLGEKITGKFLTKSYFTFIVRTLPLNFNVHRRYSDFEWLRQVLLKLYSANVIPPIPKKNKIGGVRFDELFLLKRKRYLEKFLISLLNDPVIRVSQVLYDFLSIEDDNLFVYKKKAYSNYKIPTNVSEFKSPDGKIDITINEEREINYQNIKNNTEINQELLTKFNKNLKMLNSQLTSVFNTMDEISKNCEDLFMNSFKYYDLDNMKISYYQLKDMFKNWSMALKKQSCVINVNIREYFKYIKNSYRSMREMINIVENHKQNYYKLKRNLITKKEELFKKSDVSKWELGPNKDINIVNLLKDKNIALPKILYNETIAVNNMKQLYGYYLNRAISEFERIKILNGFGYKQNVTDNAKIGITILSELFKNISDIAVSSPKYDIKNIQKEFEQNDFIEPNQNKK